MQAPSVTFIAFALQFWFLSDFIVCSELELEITPKVRMRSSPSPSSSYYSSSSDSDSSTTVRQGRITKASRDKREQRETMAKLQKMVPYAKEGDSQLQLLQHVMDYIYFLQVFFSFHLISLEIYL